MKRHMVPSDITVLTAPRLSYLARTRPTTFYGYSDDEVRAFFLRAQDVARVARREDYRRACGYLAMYLWQILMGER